MSKGFENMGKEALSIDANTFQFFTRNPRGGKAKQLDQNDIDKFLKLAKENNFFSQITGKTSIYLIRLPCLSFFDLAPTCSPTPSPVQYHRPIGS